MALLLDPLLWILAIVLMAFALRAGADDLTQSCESFSNLAPPLEPSAASACETDDEGDE